MKLSMSWVFDHIEADRSAVDFEHLITALGKTTAEIDGVAHHRFDWERFFVGTVSSVDATTTTLHIAEKNKTVALSLRSELRIGSQVLLVSYEGGYRWASFADLAGVREGSFPEVFVAEGQIGGTWRRELDSEDWIIDIDNKSLTNRPDLWGHRGFAREIAAILKVKLLSEEQISSSLPICHFAHSSDLAVIEDPEVCNRFAAIKVQGVSSRPSSIWMSSRLVRVGGKPISAIVDTTNYVMFDLGHPMHAFDADKVVGEQLVVRRARDGESLVLLDGSNITLSSQDCVVADQARVLSLAGVMGGLQSSITAQTNSIILEAAHFDPTAIRISAQRAKVRTESSMRFEKGLDPHANVTAIERFLSVMKKEDIPGIADDSVISLGKVFDDTVITLAHKTLVEKLGYSVVEPDVVAIFERLGFGVRTEQVAGGVVYQVHVPLFRSFKDVRIPEDLIEEVARFVGYDAIPQVLPSRQMKPFDLSVAMRRRAIKHHCAFGCGMHEVSRYSLYDETFLREVDLAVGRAQELKNPISENYRRLVTSLIPHLLQAISINAILRDELRFFEVARTWRFENESDSLPREQEQLAGVMFARKGLDFYQAKQSLVSLFDLCGVYPEWRPANALTCPAWFDPTHSAELWIDDEFLGHFGAIEKALLQRLVAGRACCFAFEVNTAAFISDVYRTQPTYRPLSRYQATFFDVSIFAPYTTSVAQLQNSIASLDARIREVALVDMFEKPEWKDARSVTIRYLVQDDDETLTKEALDEIQAAVVALVRSLGGEVR